MLSFKILCKVIANNRITIPKDIAKFLDLKEGDLIQIELQKIAEKPEVKQ